MNTNEKTDTALPLAPPALKSDGISSLPEAFAGLFRGGFEAGYSSGQDAGYRKGFAEGYAAARQGALDSAAVTPAFEGKPAPNGGPRRMLLGMPCPKCRVYLHDQEAHCPSCGMTK